MFNYIITCCAFIILTGSTTAQTKDTIPSTKKSKDDNWPNYARMAGHGLNKRNIAATIKDAEETFLFGIEVDNDVTGRYDSFLDPTEKLEDIRSLAEKAHAINNHAFVYIAGLECITAKADSAEHTFFKDHPDWVQRDRNNRPAKFGGGDAFWITAGDEDVWISPYALEWRKRYMELVRKIAATGIDGIWVDIPYWMTHFEGWEDSWASFDDYTVEVFRKKTGLDARKDFKPGDMNDAGFRKWIDFRIETLTDFMAEINQNIKGVNPKCKTIAEIYPGIGEEAVRVGADITSLYKVVDVIAHEFSGGEGESNAASKNSLQWFDRMVGMYTFRAFAGEKASWMLSYSWMKKDKISAAEPMKNLAVSNLIAGTNHYDAREYVMSGSNDLQTRKIIYKWIAENENTFYKPRTSISPIGIYFSPKTRDYYPSEFIDSYQGMMKLFLQGHMSFEIVTPETLHSFKGQCLILPDVKCISLEEIRLLNQHIESGRSLLVTAETGRFDETGNENKSNLVLDLLGIASAEKEMKSGTGNKKLLYYPDCPGKTYNSYLKTELNQAAVTNDYNQTKFFAFLNSFKNDLLVRNKIDQDIRIDAPPFVSTQSVTVEGKPHLFLANFTGLKSGENAVQVPVKNIKITFVAKPNAKVMYLPFLGSKQQLKTKIENGKLTCILPAVEKAAVIWLE